LFLFAFQETGHAKTRQRKQSV